MIQPDTEPSASGTIKSVLAREVLDSRGRPTVEVTITTSGGQQGQAIAPSGASTGSAEAVELRDTGDDWYDGEGVRSAVENVCQTIGPALLGHSSENQAEVDALLCELDGSPQKSQLGGNALIATSLAAAHAGAASRAVPLYLHLHQQFCQFEEQQQLEGPAQPVLPLPMINMISGGLHAGGNIEFQDVLVMPVGAPDFPSSLEWAVRIYRRLGALLDESGYEGRLVGDEGGYGPRLPGNRAAVEMVVAAIEKAGLVPGEQVWIALDVAATHFFEEGQYRLRSEGNKLLSSEQMIDRLESWVDDYPIASIEDGLAEEDWEGWQHLTDRLGQRVQLVGDDLFATNPMRLQRGVVSAAANSVLVKVNQIGTLTETMETVSMARLAGFSTVVSARSGETEDTTIADLAVAVAADQIKIGSIVRSERLAKYNRLLRISEQLPGWSPRIATR
ncbi:MAG: phosphopyruvate hydratase [Planctomycetota bacterium]|nr:phosphopyruvate hydratase [Planctomycetota bacterium]